MATPRVLILRAPGTNCDEETAHAFALAGGTAGAVHVNRLLEKPRQLAEFQDPLHPRRLQLRRRHRRRPHPRQPDSASPGRIRSQTFRDAGKLILGICNGFQMLLKTELLAGRRRGRPDRDARAERLGQVRSRWVQLADQRQQVRVSARHRGDGTAGRPRRRKVRAAR